MNRDLYELMVIIIYATCIPQNGDDTADANPVPTDHYDIRLKAGILKRERWSIL